MVLSPGIANGAALAGRTIVKDGVIIRFDRRGRPIEPEKREPPASRHLGDDKRYLADMEAINDLKSVASSTSVSSADSPPRSPSSQGSMSSARASHDSSRSASPAASSPPSYFEFAAAREAEIDSNLASIGLTRADLEAAYQAGSGPSFDSIYAELFINPITANAHRAGAARAAQDAESLFAAQMRADADAFAAEAEADRLIEEELRVRAVQREAQEESDRAFAQEESDREFAQEESNRAFAQRLADELNAPMAHAAVAAPHSPRVAAEDELSLFADSLGISRRQVVDVLDQNGGLTLAELRLFADDCGMSIQDAFRQFQDAE